MDEDEYVAKVEKIIERDFFPELDKLKAQVKTRERRMKYFLFAFVITRAITLTPGRGKITRL